MNYLRLILTWSDCEKNYADLENKGDCIHDGIVTGDQESTVLVTGCDDEKIDVQIHSELIGDWIFSTVDGLAFALEAIESDDGYDYIDYFENPEFDLEFLVVPEDNYRI